MLDIQKFSEIIFKNSHIDIEQKDRETVNKSYDFLYDFSKKKVIYGINTGFGPMAQYKISDKNLNDLQYNIIRSHSSGAGKPLSEIYVKAAMISRFCTFISGKSGVHIQTIELLKEFINREIIPFVPEHGSVGASGDLVQLAHLALCLIGEGEVFYKGKLLQTIEVLKQENLQPLKMYLREGLSLCNGTSFMTGIGLVNLIYSQKLMRFAIIASALINEIASSYDDFLAKELNTAKLHFGQQKIAETLRNILVDSKCLKNRQKELYEQETLEDIMKQKVQPFYSLRCVPQILGPIFDEIINAEKVLVNELNSADDNPIIDIETQNIYHGGNFHGDYVSYENDKLKIGITKLTMLMERQLNYILHDKINEILPPFLNLGVLGLNYGIQGTQFTATSTTAECQTLSNPMYVHSIPNNNDNQDIVSMGTNSALIAKHVIENSFQVMSIHLMGLAQAVDILQIKGKLSSTTQKLYEDIRNIIPVFVLDNPKYKEIEKIVQYIKTTNNFDNIN
ncbi:MAG: aromatic amino acid ammonia-lyase [Bacteroidales bacterium]|jgi:histidine ammonia-lyase|nr:aromatic amino acid ammonia-lyase [Bacteroidales bacterium]